MPSPSDLSVSIDSKPARITSLRSAEHDSLLFAVIVDASTSNAAKEAAIKQAAFHIFQVLSGAGDQGYLVLFNDEVAMSKQPLLPDQVTPLLDSVKFRGGTAVYDAIGETCAQKLGRAQHLGAQRRIIVLFSDGDDNSSHIGPSTAEAEAEQNGIAVFSLNTGSVSESDEERGDQNLKEISVKTGGREFQGKNMEDATSQLLVMIRQEWIVSFVPAQSPDGKVHKLAVKSPEKRLRFSAPAHIYLP